MVWKWNGLVVDNKVFFESAFRFERCCNFIFIFSLPLFLSVLFSRGMISLLLQLQVDVGRLLRRQLVDERRRRQNGIFDRWRQIKLVVVVVVLRLVAVVMVVVRRRLLCRRRVDCRVVAHMVVEILQRQAGKVGHGSVIEGCCCCCSCSRSGWRCWWQDKDTTRITVVRRHYAVRCRSCRSRVIVDWRRRGQRCRWDNSRRCYWRFGSVSRARMSGT